MKKDVSISPKYVKSRQTIRGSRRPLFFTLVLIASVVTLAVGSAWLPSKISASRLAQTDDGGQTVGSSGQEISESAMQQIEALIEEKESRTPAQRKITSQLLYAEKMARGEAIARNVQTLAVNVRTESDRRLVVDITTTVSDSLLERLKLSGAEIIASVPEFRSVRAEVPLN